MLSFSFFVESQPNCPDVALYHLVFIFVLLLLHPKAPLYLLQTWLSRANSALHPGSQCNVRLMLKHWTFGHCAYSFKCTPVSISPGSSAFALEEYSLHKYLMELINCMSCVLSGWQLSQGTGSFWAERHCNPPVAQMEKMWRQQLFPMTHEYLTGFKTCYIQFAFSYANCSVIRIWRDVSMLRLS